MGSVDLISIEVKLEIKFNCVIEQCFIIFQANNGVEEDVAKIV